MMGDPYDGREDREDRPVRVGEAGPIDLALQHEDLMAQGEDLGVAFVAGREQPSEPADQKVTEGRDEVHRRQNVPTHAAARTAGNAVAMDFRHLQAGVAVFEDLAVQSGRLNQSTLVSVANATSSRPRQGRAGR